MAARADGKRLPDYMEQAFDEGKPVTIWGQVYTRPEDVPEQWWQGADVMSEDRAANRQRLIEAEAAVEQAAQKAAGAVTTTKAGG